MKTTYLVGGMESVSDGGSGWRELVKSSLDGVALNIIDPCATEKENTGFDVSESKKKAYAWKKKKDWDNFLPMFENIIRADLDHVRASDFIILYMNPKIRIGGTISELTLAYLSRETKRTPIYCYLDGKPEDVNSWVLAMILLNGKIFTSWKTLLREVKELCK